MTSPGPEEESLGQPASGAGASIRPSEPGAVWRDVATSREASIARRVSTLGDLGQERTPVHPGWGAHHRPKTDSITGACAPVSGEPIPSAPDSRLPGAPSPA